MIFGLHKALNNMVVATKEKNKGLMRKIPLFFTGQNLYTLEQQRLNATLFMFAKVLLISNVFNIISGCPVELIVGQFLVFTFIITLYFLSRSKKRLKRIKTVFFCP